MPDREKVMSWLEGLAQQDWRMFHSDSEVQVIAEYALALLKELEWNVLTEDADGVIHGFPGDDGQYLMTDGKDIWIDNYVDGVEDGIFLDSGRDIREITAWMNMPELPKKGRR